MVWERQEEREKERKRARETFVKPRCSLDALWPKYNRKRQLSAILIAI